MIPSTELTHFSSIANIAERSEVETPLAILSEQLGFAPSQTIPVRVAIIF